MNERDIFIAALEIEGPAAVQAFLTQTCGDDPALLSRVRELLASHAVGDSFLNTPAVEQIEAEYDAANTPTIAVSTDAENGLTDEDNEEPATQWGLNMNEEIPLGYLQPSDRADSLGRLSHYEILEVLGRGAFGTVLKAFDEKLHRVVAIKVLSPEMAATSPARKRFLREARSSAAIRHENVVNIFAVDDDPIPYLVMEYIPGLTLQERLDETGPLDLEDVLKLGKQIAHGLAAAHAEQLIHRDVKPGNILLDTSIHDRVKITDFGLARAADDASMTQSGVIAGTPLYMAPEQALGKKLDQRADLFSFGSVLYQMVTGRPPFRARNAMAVLKRVTEDTPRPMMEIIPETPAWLCEIVARLHEKNPEDRYASAQEVGDLLEHCLTEYQQGRVPKVTPKAKTVPKAPAKHNVPMPTQLRISPLFKAAAIVLVMLIGLGITEATGVTKLTSTVIRFATGAGTLVIETDDPDVKIVIDGQDVTIRGGGVEELTLRPGEYKVAALKDGRQVMQELVSITRNGRTVVRMSLEPAGNTAQVAAPRDAPQSGSWVSLFNGKDLTGWKTHPQQTNKWTVKDGILVGMAGQGNLFTERGDYRDFELRLEGRVSEIGNSGVVIRSEFGFSFHLSTFRLETRMTRGIEVDIHAGIQPQPAGSLWQLGDPRWVNPASHQVIRPNEWFVMSILAQGKHVSVRIDGQPVFDGPRDEVSFTQGHICLLKQQDAPESVQFRKIEIRELKSPTSEQSWTSLFNGKDLSGWKTHPNQPGDWQVENGILVGTPRNGKVNHLFSERGDFQDFHLRAEVQADPSVNSGIYFRSPFELKLGNGNYPSANEVAIYNDDGPSSYDAYKTGSIHNVVLYPNVLVDRFGWFTLDVEVRGQHVRVQVNGATTVDSELKPDSFRKEPRGHIVLQAMSGKVRFRKIEIQELPTSAPLPAIAPPPAIAPFDADQAKQHQQAWAKHLGVPVEYTNTLGMTFKLIPPGEFLMGSTKAEIDWLLENAPEIKGEEPGSFIHNVVTGEGPQRHVTIRQPFYLSENEVRLGDFREFVKATSYQTVAESRGGGVMWDDEAKKLVSYPENIWSNAKFAASEAHPVVFTTLADARAFCRWLGKQEKCVYDVPTEEQWEFACRAGTTTRWYFGDEDSAMKWHAWTVPQSDGHTQPVGRLATNPFGLRDLYGNVGESTITPQGKQIERGGSFGRGAYFARSATRVAAPADNAWYARGFRVVLSIAAIQQKQQAHASTIPPTAIAPLNEVQTKAADDKVELAPETETVATEPKPGAKPAVAQKPAR